MNRTPPPSTILVVDDDSGLLLLIEEALRSGGWHVVTACSGADAKAWLEYNSADLLLLDLRLNDIQGREFIGKVTAAGCPIPFIVITGQGDERVAVEMMQCGALDYLVKDANFLNFIPTVVRRALVRLASSKRLAQAELTITESRSLTQAVLTSLSAHIAVLDDQGVIVAVNEHWAQFARENGGRLFERTGVGVNYLEICRRAAAQGDLGMAANLAGIKAVIGRAQSHYSAEYSCHSPGRERWFDMTVTPLSREGGGAVVSHTDITRRKQAEEALQASDDRLRLVLQASEIGTFEVNLRNGETHWNTVEFQLLGLKPGQAPVGPESFFRFVHPDDVGQLRLQWEEATRTGLLDAEFRIIRADGREGWLAGKGRFVVEGSGGSGAVVAPARASRFLGVNFDITERKRQERRQRLQYDTARLLAAADPPTVMMPRLLQALAEFLQWDVGEFWQASAQAGRMCLMHAWHVPGRKMAAFVKESRTSSIPFLEGLPGRVIATGKPRWVVDFIRDAHPMRSLAAARAGLSSALVFPIVLNAQILGGMAFLTRREVGPDDDLLELFGSLGSQIGQYMERRRMEEELLDISEREQRRFGQDLHDGLGQRLTGLEMMSYGLVRDLEGHSPALARQARRLNCELRETVTQARLISHGLAPVSMEGEGLMRGLMELAASVSRIPGVVCRFTCDQPVCFEEVMTATHLYRIAQEAVNNALKHGRARTILITLGEEGESVDLVIENNGRAIPKENAEKIGLGFNVMRYRARMIGATLSIESVRRKCVRVTCALRKKT